MNAPVNLTQLITLVNTYEGSWRNAQLAQDVMMFLWAKYDANDDLIYPTIKNWRDLLKSTMKGNDYDTLTADEVLSILFGLIHHNRINEGVWWTMFERGVTQRLLERLLALNSD